MQVSPDEQREEDFRSRMRQQADIDKDRDDARARDCRLGVSPACPKCGSHRFVDATKVEACEDCGYSQSYW